MNYFSYDIKEHNWIVFHRASEVDGSVSFWRTIFRMFVGYCKMTRKRFNHRIKIFLGVETKPIREEYPNTPILFIANTINNARALAPVWEKMNSKDYSVIDMENVGIYYPIYMLTRYSLRYIWPLILMYLKSDLEDRRTICRNMYSIVYTMGYMKITDKILKRSKIKLVVMANDHSPMQRAFRYHASRYGIKTMYVQHATVTDKFPPLNFDYNVLDGQDALEKYIAAGPIKGNVYLLGNPRFDDIPQFRQNKAAEFSVGVAVSMVDDINITRSTIDQLIEDGYSKMVFRPHPNIVHHGEWVLFMNELKSRNIVISDPYKESPYSFLGKVRLLVTGESGLHLDALLMDVPSICFNFSNGRHFDIYGYVSKGWLRYAKTIDELRNHLFFIANNDNLSTSVDIPRYYNAAFGLPVEGETSQVISDLINAVMDDDSFDVLYSRYGLSAGTMSECNVMTYC